MSDMDKICAGCILHEEYLSALDNYTICHGYLSKDTDCPCINCLIKMMCRTTCSDLTMRSWWYEYTSERKRCRYEEEN